jgi:hypothetical protein
MIRKNIVAALFAAAILTYASAATAATEHSVQDDQTFVFGWHGDPGPQLDKLSSAGIDVIRVNVLHVKGSEPVDPVWGTDNGGGEWGLTSHADMPAYDAAVNLMLSKGFKVEVTLVWYGQSDPVALRTWMKKIAAHLAGRVFRFSILNEPDMTLNDVDACDPQDIKQMITEGTLMVKRVRVNVYKRLKHSRRYRGRRYRRISVPSSTGKPKFLYQQSKKGKYKRVKRWRRIAVAGTSTYEQDAVSVATGCLRVRQGLKYRRIVRAVAPAIRDVTPASTQIAAGDTSSSGGVLLFIGAANRGQGCDGDASGVR